MEPGARARPVAHRLGGYREHPPPRDLGGVVDALWVYARDLDSPPIPGGGHRVLPETGVSLCFRCRRDARGRVREPSLLLMGSILTPRRFDPRPGEHLEGIRVRAEWSREAFSIDPSEHHDGQGELAAVRPDRAGRLLSALARTRGSDEALAVLVDEVRRADPRRAGGRGSALVHASLERLGGRRGATLGFEALAGELGVSARHLRRMIKRRTGLAPKRLQRVWRLGRAVRTTDRSPDPRWARLAAETGFYDQAHLIGEFRDLAGATPTEIHRERRAQRRPELRR